MPRLSMCCTRGCLSFSPPKPPAMTPGVSHVWWHCTQDKGVTVAQTWVWGASLGQTNSCKDGCQHPSCPHRLPQPFHAAPYGLPFPRVCGGCRGLVSEA